MHAVRHSRTRLVAVLATLALGSVLTACGADEPEATDAPNAAASTVTPSSAPSDAVDEPSPVDDGGEVAVDQFADRLTAGIENTEQAHIEFTMSGAGGEMEGSGDVDYTADPPEMQMTMDIAGQSIGMVLVDETIYVKSSMSGDKYSPFDLSDPTNPLGEGFAEQLDPTASMRSFVTALSSVVSAGREDVDGRQLDRYELTIDTTKLSGQTASDQLPQEMKVTVWLDGRDRMARSVMNMGAITYDASMTAFDKALDLKAPPADQISKKTAG